MRKIKSHNLGIEQGSIVLFSDFQHDGVMWSGSGKREFRSVVTFERPFSATPIVQIGLSMWDFDKDRNQRADISAEMINPQGFTILFKTWGDTRIARVRADWTAFGEMRDDDDWQLG